jgi:predicted Zn-dependent protease
LRLNFSIFILLLKSLVFSSISIGAQPIQEGVIIRDAEIEATLIDFTSPIFQAAGLKPENLKIFLIADSDINAFATTEYSIFLNSGLILKSKTPEQVIGVLAHETGHIAGGHLAGREGMASKATIMTMAGMVLGAAAMLAGSADAAAGLMMGSMQMAQNTFMHYNRGQEGSADSAGVKYLDKLHWSSKGFYEFMQILEKQELLSAERQDLYMRSHPFSRDRVEFLKTYISNSPYTQSNLPDKFYVSFKRILAKLEAFLLPAGQVFLKYAQNNTSLEARYARAIAYYRSSKITEALSQTEKLLHDYPKDPYFWELKGQINFENGNVPAAIHAYKQAKILKPDAALIRLSYAQAILEANTQAYDREAISELNKVLQKEKENPFTWHLLAIAHGRQKNIGISALCLAEEALTVGKYDLALNQAKRAEHILSTGPEKVRAEDIKDLAERELKKQQTNSF